MRSLTPSLLLCTLAAAGCSADPPSDGAVTTNTARVTATVAPPPNESAAPSAAGGADVPTATPAHAPSDVECAADALPTLCLDLSLAGAVEFDGQLTDLTPSALDCGAWVEGGQEFGGPDVYSLPALNSPPPGGPTFTLFAVLSAYRGPGTYDLAEVSGLGTPMAILVDDVMFEAADVTTGSVTVDGDAGGSLTITGLVAFGDPEPRAPVLDLALRWTCTDPAG